MKQYKQLQEIGTAILLVALLALWAALLAVTEPDREVTAARKRLYAVAKVTEVLSDDAAPDSWTEGRRLGEQLLEVQLLTGEHKGESLQTYNYLSAYLNVDAKESTRIIVRLDYDENGSLYVVSIPNYDRAPMLIGLLLIFSVLLIIIGRKKGVMALLGLVYTLAALWFVLIPMLLRGAEPLLITIIIVALTTVACLVMLTGFSRKTLCAVLGCISGVAVAGILAAIAGKISPLNGFNMSEAEELVLRAYDSELHISGLFVCGILIASLGAVMDVAMSISSACWELRIVNPTIPRKELFRSGMNIGRDAMGTMTNTLILAFSGTSVNMLLLFQVYDYPLIQIFNSDAMAIELIRGLAGSIGIVLTVPLVAGMSAWLMRPQPPQNGVLPKERTERAD